MYPAIYNDVGAKFAPSILCLWLNTDWMDWLFNKILNCRIKFWHFAILGHIEYRNFLFDAYHTLFQVVRLCLKQRMKVMANAIFPSFLRRAVSLALRLAPRVLLSNQGALELRQAWLTSRSIWKVHLPFWRKWLIVMGKSRWFWSVCKSVFHADLL